LSAMAAQPADWPQFRGPGGSAFSDTATPPLSFSPSTNLQWKTPLPLGYSSPVVAGDRVFVTGGEGVLETIALSRKDGRILWGRPAMPENSAYAKDPSGPGPAAATPATDGAFVYVLF